MQFLNILQISIYFIYHEGLKLIKKFETAFVMSEEILKTERKDKSEAKMYVH